MKIITQVFAVLAIFTLMLALVACGDDSGDANPNENATPGSLGALDADGKLTLCETVVGQSPAECWQEGNSLMILAVKAAEISDEVTACVDTLGALNQEATPNDVVACFSVLDEACDFENEDACEALIPENYQTGTL